MLIPTRMRNSKTVSFRPMRRYFFLTITDRKNVVCVIWQSAHHIYDPKNSIGLTLQCMNAFCTHVHIDDTSRKLILPEHCGQGLIFNMQTTFFNYDLVNLK